MEKSWHHQVFFLQNNKDMNLIIILMCIYVVKKIGDDNTIMLWDLGSGKRLKTMTGHTDVVYSLQFSMDNNVLVSGGLDETVRIWDVNQNEDADVMEGITDSKRIRLDSSRNLGKGKKILER